MNKVKKYIIVALLIALAPVFLQKTTKPRNSRVSTNKSTSGLAQSQATNMLFNKLRKNNPDKVLIYAFDSWRPGRNNADLKYIASKYNMLVTDGRQFYNEKVDYLHSLNPNLVVLAYQNANAVTQNSAEWQQIIKESPEWLLKDKNNNLVSEQDWLYNKVLNPTNPAYRQWLVTKLKNQVEQNRYDGIYLDMVGSYLWIGKGGYKTRPTNPQTKKDFTDNEWLEANKKLVRDIKAAIGTDKPLIINGFGTQNGVNFNQSPAINLVTEADGPMMEYFLRWSSSGPQRSMQEQLTDMRVVKTLAKDKIVMVNTPMVSKESGQESAMASFLLASGNTGFFRFRTSFKKYNNLYNVKIGQPISDVQVQGSLYKRLFSKGAVFLNTGNKNISVNLGIKMRTLNNQRITTLNLPPNSARILLR